MNIEDFVGKMCWQCQAFKIFRIGVIKQAKSERGWTMVLVEWERGDATWEKVMNLGFSLPKSVVNLIQD